MVAGWHQPALLSCHRPSHITCLQLLWQIHGLPLGRGSPVPGRVAHLRDGTTATLRVWEGGEAANEGENQGGEGGHL